MKTYNILNFPQLMQLNYLLENHKGYIAGGCFKNILNGEPVKDIDIFFNNADDFIEAVRLWESDEYIQCGWEKIYENTNAIGFKNSITNIYVDLVSKILDKPLKLIKKFDFSITKMAYYKNIDINYLGETTISYHLIGHPDFFEHLVTKRMVIDDRILFPCHTLKRSYRYANYGYKLCYKSLMKIALALQDIPHEEYDIFYQDDINDIKLWNELKSRIKYEKKCKGERYR